MSLIPHLSELEDINSHWENFLSVSNRIDTYKADLQNCESYSRGLTMENKA